MMLYIYMMLYINFGGDPFFHLMFLALCRRCHFLTRKKDGRNHPEEVPKNPLDSARFFLSDKLDLTTLFQMDVSENLHQA